MYNKTKNRIALMSPFFFPEKISTGKYNSALTEMLVKKGASVHVICSHPLYPNWQPHVSHSTLPGTQIHRGGARVYYPQAVVLRRLILEFWYSIHALIQIIKIRKELDTVIAVFPPTLFFIFVKLILPRNIRCVGIIHDLLGVMVNSKQSGMRKVISKVMRLVEISAFKRCDLLVCLSDSMKEMVADQYNIARDKLSVHYPFVSSDNLHATSDKLEKIFPDGFLHVVYSGALGEKQIPDRLVEFMLLLVSNKENIQCHIFSEGPKFNELKAGHENDTNNKIRFHELVDEDSLGELYARSSIQIIPQATGTGAGAFPSKLPNLLAAGVPVFVMCDHDSELAKVTQQSGIGFVASSWNVHQWVEEFNSFAPLCIGQSHSERQQKVASMLLEKFSAEPLVHRILNEV